MTLGNLTAGGSGGAVRATSSNAGQVMETLIDGAAVSARKTNIPRVGTNHAALVPTANMPDAVGHPVAGALPIVLTVTLHQLTV